MLYNFRDAMPSDMAAIVSLLADDELGASREGRDAATLKAYGRAFAAIEADPNNELLVADHEGRVIGVLQLTYIPGLSRSGAWRAQIEGVRVASDIRGQGLGEAMIEEALKRARRRGCALAQLTSDKQRTAALRFYERLGFTASHEGFKRAL